MGKVSRKRRLFILLAASVVALILLISLVLTRLVFIPTDNEAGGDVLGMVLIDILDDKTAAFYHVNHFGVYVLAVDENSAACQKGIRSGDRIESINDRTIASTTVFSQMLDEIEPSEMLNVHFRRGEEEQPVDVLFSYEDLND